MTAKQRKLKGDALSSLFGGKEKRKPRKVPGPRKAEPEEGLETAPEPEPEDVVEEVVEEKSAKVKKGKGKSKVRAKAKAKAKKRARRARPKTEVVEELEEEVMAQEEPSPNALEEMPAVRTSEPETVAEETPIVEVPVAEMTDVAITAAAETAQSVEVTPDIDTTPAVEMSTTETGSTEELDVQTLRSTTIRIPSPAEILEGPAPTVVEPAPVVAPETEPTALEPLAETVPSDASFSAPVLPSSARPTLPEQPAAQPIPIVQPLPGATQPGIAPELPVYPAPTQPGQYSPSYQAPGTPAPQQPMMPKAYPPPPNQGQGMQRPPTSPYGPQVTGIPGVSPIVQGQGAYPGSQGYSGFAGDSMPIQPSQGTPAPYGAYPIQREGQGGYPQGYTPQGAYTPAPGSGTHGQAGPAPTPTRHLTQNTAPLSMNALQRRQFLARTRQFGFIAPSALLNLMESMSVLWRQHTEERLPAKELFISGALMALDSHLNELRSYGVPEIQLAPIQQQLEMLKDALLR